MYPKNAASPEPIAIGAVVQISDGAVQTSGCTVRIKPIGVAEGDGAGTTAYSTDGIVYYTPTQGETNYTSFILIAKKTGCIPVSVTVVTTSSVTPGTVLLAPTTHASAVVPTVSTLTGHTPQTGDTYALANGSSGFVATKADTAAILVDTNELQSDWTNGGRLDLIVDAILDDTDLIDDGTSGLAKIATDVAAILVDTGTTLQAELDGIQADTEDIQARLPAALTADGNIKADTLRVGGTLQTAGDIPALVTTVDTVVDTILVDTAEIGAAGVGLTALAQSSVWTGTLATNLATTNSTVATNLNATITSRMASYTQPTGFLAATFPTTVASTTNITAASGVALSSAGNTAVATAVEAAILNEGDATALLAAIAAKVEEFLVNEGDATATIAAIATACNSAIVAGTVGSNVTAIKAKTDNLPASPASTTNITAGTITTVTNLTNMPTVPTNWLTADGLATDAVNEIRNAITGGAYDLDTDANGRIRVVDGTGAGEISLTSGLLDWNTAWDAEVQSEVNDALVALNLDHLLAVATGSADMTTEVVDNSIVSRMLSNGDTSVFDPSTDGLQPIRDRGDAAWGTATGFSTHSASDVWAVATRVLTAATNITAAIADQVWEEAIADHSGTSGSTAEALGAAGSAGDPWSTALPGAYGAGSAGFIIGTNLDAILSARTLASASYATASALATVDTVVDGIQTDLSNATDGLGALKTLIDALPSQADITGGAYALNTSATGSIRVVDGTGTDEISLTSGLIAGIAGTITTLDALDTAQDSQHATSQASLSTLLSRLVGTIATGTHQPQSGDAYSYLGTNLGANGVNSTEAGGTGDHLSAIPNMATATALATVDTVADTILSKLVVASGTIDNSLGDATSTVFKTSLTNIDATWNDQLIRITSGALNGQVKPVLSFDQTNGVFTLEEGFTGAPSNGVTFDILPSHVHPVSQIQSGLSTISASDVWASATRTLTAIDEDSTTIDLDAAIRAAVGMSSANLDTQLAGLPTQAEITGGSYSLATDANGRIRIVDGIGTGELDTLSGTVLLRSATQASIDAIQTSTGTKMVRYFSAIARGDGAAFVDLATEVGEINQNYGSGAGSYSTLFDSQEAARDQLVAVGNDVDSVLEDTDELQSDWENGGRLDLLVDAIKAKTDQMTYTVANKLDSNPTPTAAICNKISDHVRRRTQANVEASSDGDTLSLSSLYGFIQQAQESSISGTTLTVNRTDGTTALGTKTLTSNASAEPVTGIA